MVEGERALQAIGGQVSVRPEPADVVDQRVQPRIGVEDRDGEPADRELMSVVNASTAGFPEAARMSAAACSARARSDPGCRPGRRSWRARSQSPCRFPQCRR